MCHIVEACPLTKLADDGLLQLHSADDTAIKWLVLLQRYVRSKFKVAPSLWGVNARGSSNQIFQIAVISEYVSKFS